MEFRPTAARGMTKTHLGAGAGGVYAAGAEGLVTLGADTAGADTAGADAAGVDTPARTELGEDFHDGLARGCHLPLEEAGDEGLETRAGAAGAETAGAAGAAGALPPLRKRKR